MPAGTPRAGPVADLILLETRITKPGDGVLVHRGFQFVVETFYLPRFQLSSQWRVGFVLQSVTGEVFGIERERLVQVITPFGIDRTRDPHDEIQIDGSNPRLSNVVDGTRDVARLVMSFQHLERRGLKALTADTHPVHSTFHQDIGDDVIDGLGIRLDGPLTVGSQRQVTHDGIKQP